MSSPSHAVMLPVDECLFGITRKCPKMSTSSSTAASSSSPRSNHGTDNGNENEKGGGSVNVLEEPDDHDSDSKTTKKSRDSGNNNNNYDSFHLGHWGEAEQQHDISLVQLRKLCAQGIADEGSHRGVAWRVLLELLPCHDIHKTWPKAVAPHRELYTSLVEQYFLPGSLDQGRELRGSLGKRFLRNRALRNKYNRMQRLDEGDSPTRTTTTPTPSSRSDTSSTNHKDGDDDGSYDSDDNGSDEEGSVTSEQSEDAPHKQQQQQNQMNQAPPPQTLLKIQDRLSLKFKEQWKRSGINLDKAVATESSTALALGINHLVVPEFDDTMQDEFIVFLEDATLLEEIRKDVVRTHPDLYFFLEPKDNLGLRRYAALERILFVWAKLNKGVRMIIIIILVYRIVPRTVSYR
jgi:hypothetical protein